MAEQFANNPTSTLNGGIDNAVTAIVLASVSGFSTTGNFRILVDSEIMKVTAVNAGTVTLTVVRGQEGTSAASHLTGATVTQLVTAAAVAALKADTLAAVVSVGASGSRPSATGSGLLYYCTDIPVSYVDNPGDSKWHQFVAGCPLPSAGGNTYTTAANLTLNNFADVVRASMHSNTGALAQTALATGTLTNTATWVVNLVGSFIGVPGTTFPEFGICVSTGTSGGSTAYGCMIYWFTGGEPAIASVTFNPGGARLTAPVALQPSFVPFSGGVGGMVRLRLLADGTNLHYQYSTDGFHFSDMYCVATPGSLADYGFWIGSDSTGTSYVQALVYRNDLTTLTVAAATITGATNATPIVITATAHGFQDGDLVAVHGVGGNTNANSGTTTGALGAAADSAWIIQRVDANTFNLIGSAGNSAYTSGGTAVLIGR